MKLGINQYILITHCEASVYQSALIYPIFISIIIICMNVPHSCLLNEVIIERLPPLRRKCPLMVLASGIKFTWLGRELLLCLLE
jgi:hypothetical protein